MAVTVAGRAELHTAADTGVKEFGIPAPFAPRTGRHASPDVVTANGLYSDDAGFSAAAALDHALNRFQNVKVIAVDPSRSHGEHFLGLAPVRKVDCREPPRDGNRGTGHQRKSKMPRRVDHVAGPVPIPREMLVVEDGNAAPAFAKDVDDLCEEFVSWVKGLLFFVSRIVAVFTDEQDAVDSQLSRAERQRLGDGRVNPHRRELFGP